METKTVKMSRTDFDGLPPMLTPIEAAGLLRISRKSLDRWIRQGRIPTAKLSPAQSSRRLIRRSALVEFLETAEENSR